MTNGSERDKDFRRINSINLGTPGHWWSDYEQRNINETSQIDPGKLNLNQTADFLLFLRAIANGEQKSISFLKKIPKQRKAELKTLHSQLEGFFFLLDQ